MTTDGSGGPFNSTWYSVKVQNFSVCLSMSFSLSFCLSFPLSKTPDAFKGYWKTTHMVPFLLPISGLSYQSFYLFTVTAWLSIVFIGPSIKNAPFWSCVPM